MTRNLAIDFRIAANTLRRMAEGPDAEKAVVARRILDDPGLFRNWVNRRAERTSQARRQPVEGEGAVGS